MNKLKAFLSTCDIHHLKRSCITISITTRMILFTAIGIIGFTLFFLTGHALKAPFDFPVGRVITIDEGATLTEIGDMLEDEYVIKSSVLFELAVRWYGDESGVMAGDYFFEKAHSAGKVAKRMIRGEQGLDPITIMIPEGSTIFDMAALFEAVLPEFNPIGFIELARDTEGYLFPDTYDFLPNVTEEQVIDELNQTFYERIVDLQDSIISTDLTLEETVILASIIQREAWKAVDQKLISGVLHNRLNIDMPLQVDATFNYINGKNTYQLTYDDLAIDSQYNTYKYKGLPVGPICNPGLAALEAAVYPTESDYIFYLADREGNTYYTDNYNEHIRNKAKYID